MVDRLASRGCGHAKASRVLAFYTVGPSHVWMEGWDSILRLRPAVSTRKQQHSRSIWRVTRLVISAGKNGSEFSMVCGVNPRKCTSTRKKSHHLSHQAGASAALWRGPQSAKSFVFNGAEGGIRTPTILRSPAPQDDTSRARDRTSCGLRPGASGVV